MIFKGEFGLVQKPQTQTWYSTEEIAQILDCTTAAIRNIASYYHIPFDKEVKYKTGRRALYSYDSFRKIKERHDARQNRQMQKFLSERKDMTPEEVARLEDHSLVTDKRCLDLNFWPDTVPNCFKELDA